MAFDVILQPRAERDIIEAYAYIAAEAPDAAQRWYKRLRAEIESLSEMPARCPPAPAAEKLGSEIRQLLFGKRSGVYRVIFRIDDARGTVEVLAVRHGARKPIESEDMAGW